MSWPYSFLSQIVSFGETIWERDYVYCRALASNLRDETTIERLDSARRWN